MRDYGWCALILGGTYAAIIVAWWLAAVGWTPAIIAFCVAGIAYVVRDAVTGD